MSEFSRISQVTPAQQSDGIAECRAELEKEDLEAGRAEHITQRIAELERSEFSGISQVAPAQQSDEICKPCTKCPDQAALIPQPKISGNGCCCQCCGGASSDISIADIQHNGTDSTKWIQKQDGRIIEYYTFGSEEPDAKIFIIINGSNGSAQFFSEMPSMVTVLKEKNVKGISINIPGHGFTSRDPLRRMGEWAKSDVEPVLQAEGVFEDAPLMVEGSSHGSSHAHSVMHYFQDRVTHVHLHVPALAIEVAEELKLDPIAEGLSCTGDYTSTCFLINCCSPCLFCCCSCLLPQMPGCVGGLAEFDGYNEIGFDAVTIMGNSSIKHSSAAGVHGIIDNSLLGQLYRETGFHPFNDIKVENVQKMKIMVSYGKDDPSSPESHGEYLAKYYSEKCNREGKLFKNVEPGEVVGNSHGGKCLVNHKPGGHEAHFIPYFKGDLLRKVLEL